MPLGKNPIFNQHLALPSPNITAGQAHNNFWNNQNQMTMWNKLWQANISAIKIPQKKAKRMKRKQKFPANTVITLSKGCGFQINLETKKNIFYNRIIRHINTLKKDLNKKKKDNCISPLDIQDMSRFLNNCSTTKNTVKHLVLFNSYSEIDDYGCDYRCAYLSKNGKVLDKSATHWVHWVDNNASINAVMTLKLAKSLRNKSKPKFTVGESYLNIT